MTPGAFARLNALSHSKLVAVVEMLAAHVGVTAELDALRAHRPSVKNPAQSMLHERQLMIVVIQAIHARLTQETADEFVTPPPSRSRGANSKAA